jgi:hypothetical protein
MSCVKNTELDGIDLTAADSIRQRQQLAIMVRWQLNV